MVHYRMLLYNVKLCGVPTLYDISNAKKSSSDTVTLSADASERDAVQKNERIL